jgi:AAT family amino acid transporter
MKPRQLTMMGLGSAIGAGLFLGSGAGVQAAGPAVLVSYLVAGTLIILVMWALGEMAAASPNSGAFSVYAERAMGKTAGATVGWLWWLQLVVVIAAEALGAAGLLFSVWPVVPVWALSLVFMVVFTGINLAGVKNFGEFEFWFAILKVTAIVLFLVIGAALLLGLLPDAASPGLANITGDFAPSGLAGIATALFVVIFAFGGTEIVSVAAAETENPEHSVTKAIRTVVWRILVFYIGSVFVIAAVLPATSDALSSPFAGVLDAARIPGCRHRHHPGGRRRPAVRPEREPVRGVPHGVLAGRARRGSRLPVPAQRRGSADGRRRRLRRVRLHRHGPGTAVPRAHPASPVPARRIHMPRGLGFGTGLPAHSAPAGRP